MIKIGCCVNMVADDPAGVGINRIATLAKLGYDYVEIPLAQAMALSEEEFAGLLEMLADNQLSCIACNNFFPATLRLTGEQTTPKAEIAAYVEQAIGRALRLGAKSVVFGSSGAKNIPAGFPYEKAWEQIVELLQMVDEIIGDKPIKVAIEPLNQEESNLVVNAHEGLALAKAVNRPNIRLLVDFFHLSMENEDVAILGEAKDYLQHMHLANPTGRIWPVRGDGVDYRSFFVALSEAGYTGGVSIEAFTDDFDKSAAEGLLSMREIVSTL